MFCLKQQRPESDEEDESPTSLPSETRTKKDPPEETGEFEAGLSVLSETKTPSVSQKPAFKRKETGGFEDPYDKYKDSFFRFYSETFKKHSVEDFQRKATTPPHYLDYREGNRVMVPRVDTYAAASATGQMFLNWVTQRVEVGIGVLCVRRRLVLRRSIELSGRGK